MDNIKDKLVRASKIYGDQTIIRAAINAIPYVGSSVDILLSSSGQTFIIKRIENFISELEKQIGLLDKSKINSEFLKTEQGFDIIIKAFNSASRTRQTEKLKLYSKIIKGAISLDKEYEEDEPETYLRIVEELTLKELKVAKCLFELKENKIKYREEETLEAEKMDGTNDAWFLSKRHPEFNRDELISIFIRLERTGLIKELVGSFLGYGGGQYLINPLFRKFMIFIENMD